MPALPTLRTGGWIDVSEDGVWHIHERTNINLDTVLKEIPT